ncbi:MAG: metal-dependent hydrolase [Methanomicrobiales archaeon]
MLAEHFVFTSAIAVIVGMLFFHYTGRDSSWIIILVSYAPDFDKVSDRFLNQLGFTVLFDGNPIHHGTFHNIAAMLLFAVIIAFLLHPLGFRFFDTVIFSIIGFGAHLFEDALVYPSHYMYLWPFSREKLGLAWLPVNGYEESYNSNFFHIANTEVLIIGLTVLLIAILLRTWFEGAVWIRWYMPEKVYLFLFPIKKA